MGHDDLHERFKSFGWHVIDVADGNSIEQLHAAFEEAKKTKGQPTAIIAKTIKGKGVSFMENDPLWHHAELKEADYERARAEIEKEM